MPYKYIGRTNDFLGKPLWEIVGNLKHFGVGRIVVRQRFERYPEPSFMKIVKVETLPDEELKKVKVWVEKTFRGRKCDRLVEMCSTTYKPDYRLLSKAEEDAYCNRECPKVIEKVFPRTVPFPPILRELLVRDMILNGEKVKEPELPVVLKKGRENHARLAKEDEEPNAELSVGLGTPAHPSLYKNINIKNVTKST